MAHVDPLPRETLNVIAKQIGERLSVAGNDAINAGKSLELGTTLAVWSLGLDATTNPSQPLRQLAARTGVWHHQIRHDGEAMEFARSTPHGAGAEDWQVRT